MTYRATDIPLFPKAALPEDPELPALPQLFDGGWVWDACCREFGPTETYPRQIRVRQVSHVPGRQAVLSYMAEWAPDDYIPSEHFTIRMSRGQPVELFLYPNDRHLPGLCQAADPETAIELVNNYVLALRSRRAIHVELIRYRPGNRAVLRHRLGKTGFYVRVVRPDALDSVLKAAEIIGKSEFVAPRLAGLWRDGGVMWLSEIPGVNLRKHLRKGRQPDPGIILDGLESLWALPPAADCPPFDLARTYRRAKRSFRHALKGDEDAQNALNGVIGPLDSFVASWQPTSTAHNDFYDDQMLVLPEGKVAVVDFEEAGLGDPMLDAGNFLAHLRWSAEFSRKRSGAEASGAYCQVFRKAALDRMQWDSRELAMREAVCLFRICTNSIRHIQADWRSRLKAGLSLVSEAAR